LKRFEEKHGVTISPEAYPSGGVVKRPLHARRASRTKPWTCWDEACARIAIPILSMQRATKRKRQSLRVDVVRQAVSEKTKIPLGAHGRKRARGLVAWQTISSDGLSAKMQPVNLSRKRFSVSCRLKARIGPRGGASVRRTTASVKPSLQRRQRSFLFESERAMVRIDIDEFIEKHTARGSSVRRRGYVGHAERGVDWASPPLSVLRRAPDEVEKAHPDVLNLFLQVFEDATY